MVFEHAALHAPVEEGARGAPLDDGADDALGAHATGRVVQVGKGDRHLAER